MNMDNDNKTNAKQTKHQTHTLRTFLLQYQGNFSSPSVLEVSGVKGPLLLLWSDRSLETDFYTFSEKLK